MNRPVAFVVQRCGLEVNGGAEYLCRMVAQRLTAVRPTEVLTTCALDYMTWENHYPPGEERIGDLHIRRFPVAKPRNVEAFNRLSASLQPRVKTAPLAEQEQWMREQGPWSPALLAYLEEHRADYDAFVFVTYLYATTYFGLPLVEDKALLVPLAHDEWPIYFTMWDRFFERLAVLVSQHRYLRPRVDLVRRREQRRDDLVKCVVQCHRISSRSLTMSPIRTGTAATPHERRRRPGRTRRPTPRR
jgi:hypothetical protein